ncbi:MAG: hypothetical protein WCW31_00910 [Patescibacteria group bacterium]|jgi:hypothetical protein
MKRGKAGKKSRFEHEVPFERDVWYWVEHVAHWYALFFVAVSILTFAYLFLNNSAPTFAGQMLP